MTLGKLAAASTETFSEAFDVAGKSLPVRPLAHARTPPSSDSFRMAQPDLFQVTGPGLKQVPSVKMTPYMKSSRGPPVIVKVSM